MWERFSYFGMASLLVLYMVKYLLLPGRSETVIGYGTVKAALESLFGPLDTQPLASQIFGFYTGLAYLTPILGGCLADRVLGQRSTAVIGALLMAAGHFMMAVEALLFRARCCCSFSASAAFKPNISTQVGALYAPGDPRRDCAPIRSTTSASISARSWRRWYAARSAKRGRLALRLRGGGRRHADRDRDLSLRPALHAAATNCTHARRAAETAPLDRDERRAVVALLCVFALVAFFWATYDQQGNTLLLWAEDFTERNVDLGFWRGGIPTTWFLALNPLMIFVFTPILVRLWARQSRHGRGCRPIEARVRFLLCRARQPDDGRGGMDLRPAPRRARSGSSAISPSSRSGNCTSRRSGWRWSRGSRRRACCRMMMGLWFAATFPGDILGGWLGGFWSTMEKATLLPDDRRHRGCRRRGGVRPRSGVALGVRRRACR